MRVPVRVPVPAQMAVGSPAHVAAMLRRMGSAGRDEKTFACTEHYARASLHSHLYVASDDVAHLFSRMHVPSRLDAYRNLSHDLHDLATRN